MTYRTTGHVGDRLAISLPFKSDEIDGVLDVPGRTRDDTVPAIAAPEDFAWPTGDVLNVVFAPNPPLLDRVSAALR
jgi:hypothetical protein